MGLEELAEYSTLELQDEIGRRKKVKTIELSSRDKTKLVKMKEAFKENEQFTQGFDIGDFRIFLVFEWLWDDDINIYIDAVTVLKRTNFNNLIAEKIYEWDTCEVVESIPEAWRVAQQLKKTMRKVELGIGELAGKYGMKFDEFYTSFFLDGIE